MKAVKTERKAKDDSGNTEIFVRYEGSDSLREVLERVAMQGRYVLQAIKGTSYEKVQERPKKKVKTEEGEGKGKAATSKASDEDQKLVEFCVKMAKSLTNIDRALREVKGEAFFKRMLADLPRQAGKSDQINVVADGATIEEVKKQCESEAVLT